MMKSDSEHSSHWTQIVKLVEDARNDPDLLYTLRNGTPDELDAIYESYGITSSDLEQSREELSLFIPEGVVAFGKWFF